MKPRLIWTLTILTLPVALLILIIAPVLRYLHRTIRAWHHSIDKHLGE